MAWWRRCDKSAYVASKHGVVGLTKAVALETATTGITCNAICPGWVLTPLVQKQIDALAEREKLGADEARNKLLEEKQPSLDFATPEQLGALGGVPVLGHMPRRSTALPCQSTAAGSRADRSRGRGAAGSGAVHCRAQNAPNHLPSTMTTASASSGPTRPTIMISR